jgi:pSer/pThr/pTyr-binding forkhead associated (FHA) protein
MRLVVKQGERTINELQFGKGPIYIGRQPNSQVFLPDTSVSRQHAVIFATQDGEWMVEDLDSANKTYLNGEAIHKVDIKSGDSLRITDYTIDIDLEETVGAAETVRAVEAEKTKAGKAVHLEDTLAVTARGPQIVERKLGTADAPPVRLPAKRATDFLEASEVICKAGSLDELLLAVLDVITKQFGSYHNWCALRTEPTGPMTCHAGRQRDGQTLDLNDLKLSDKITQSIEKDQFLLFIFSRELDKPEEGQIRSVVIAPIMGPGGCYGVMYSDNAIRDEHYNLGDLDYLMLVGIHTAAALRKL